MRRTSFSYSQNARLWFIFGLPKSKDDVRWRWENRQGRFHDRRTTNKRESNKKKWRVLDHTPLTTATGEWEKNLKKGIFVKRNKKTVGIREETVERKERSDIELFPPKSRGHEDGWCWEWESRRSKRSEALKKREHIFRPHIGRYFLEKLWSQLELGPIWMPADVSWWKRCNPPLRSKRSANCSDSYRRWNK